MTDSTLLGPWIRRFLLEHLVAERNLALNTQKSYRDMLMQLLPYTARKAKKALDRLTVDDLSPQTVRLFLSHMETTTKLHDKYPQSAPWRHSCIGPIHC